MARLKLISDAEVFATVRQMLAAGGEKAVAFASVARATGLAASTLVQRFGNRDAMLRLALLAAWEALDNATNEAEANAPMTAKGAHGMLKALGIPDPCIFAADFRDPALRQRAKAWRQKVEAALAARLDGDAPDEAAAMVFAAWQGQLLWHVAGGKGFRLKDAIRIISG